MTTDGSADDGDPGHPRSERVAWFNPTAGIAGDMALAALVDAGASTATVVDAVERLDLPGVELAFEPVDRGGIRALRARVGAAAQHDHRPVGEVLRLLATAPLPAPISDRAASVFERLAAAEGAVHGVDPENVELHEVGSIDAIVDVVGICAALDDVGIDVVASAPVALGSGPVRSAHGVIPGPAPGTMALLAAAGVPVRGLDTPSETTTPTGAAIIAALGSQFGPIPSMTPVAIGYGAGTADPEDRANVVQVVLGERSASSDGDVRPLVVLETNLDDVTGEVLAHATARLLETGARDVWLTPVLMKKGRPGHQLSVLCDPGGVAELRAVILDETGTLGVRSYTVERLAVARREDTVTLDGMGVRVKRTARRDKPEFDDVAAIARERRRPVRDVLAAVEALLSSRRGSRPPTR